MRRRHQAYTLIEILVVLSIASIVAAITLSGFDSIREGNKRTSCQANLSQIYQACRQYANDYTDYPYLNTGMAGGDDTPMGGIGLWALYTYPKPGSPSVPAPLNTPSTVDPATNIPFHTYVRNISVFHCPDDSYLRPSGSGLLSSIPFQSDGVTFNTDYLSYQVTDDDASSTPTYSSFRLNTDTTKPVKRQLTYITATSGTTTRLNRPLDGTTIVTWCRFHRRLNGSGVTTTSPRNFDEVLFGDGTVQLIPAKQDVAYLNSSTCTLTTLTGWRRVPRDMAQSIPDQDQFKCP